MVLVFNGTFNNISVIAWPSVLLVEETRVTGANHRPVASHWHTLSHNVVSSTPRLAVFELTSVVIDTDSFGSRRSNYHIITTMTAHIRKKIDESNLRYVQYFVFLAIFQNQLLFGKILHLLVWFDNRVIKHHII